MTDMKTQAERDEARRICEAATGGPWEWEGSPPTMYAERWKYFGGIKTQVHGLNLFGRLDVDANGTANLDFIAHARNTYIPLLDAYEELEGELAEAYAEINKQRLACTAVYDRAVWERAAARDEMDARNKGGGDE